MFELSDLNFDLNDESENENEIIDKILIKIQPSLAQEIKDMKEEDLNAINYYHPCAIKYRAEPGSFVLFHICDKCKHFKNEYESNTYTYYDKKTNKYNAVFSMKNVIILVL